MPNQNYKQIRLIPYNVLKNRRGMTLIEVIIAFAIVAVLVMSFYTIFTQSVNQTDEEKNIDMALQAARSAMDAIKNQSLKEGPIQIFDQTIDLQTWRGDAPFPIFELKYPTVQNAKLTLFIRAIAPEGQIDLNLPPKSNLSAIPTPVGAGALTDERVQLTLGDYFRSVTIDVKDSRGKIHTYEGIINIKKNTQ